jgi:Undecaprenyl-phosphate glucose phosphotransferase
MKHDPRSFDLATSVDVTQFGEVQTRGQLRETVGGSLSNSHFVAPRIVASLARLGDALIMFLAAMISAWRYPDFAGRVDSLVFFSIGLLSAIALPLILEVLGLYRLDNLIMPAKSIFKLFLAWTLLFSTLVFAIFLFKEANNISRVWLVTWAIAGYAFFLTDRFFVAALLRRFNQNGQFNRRAVIVGGGEPAARVIANLQSHEDTGISIIGYFDDRDDNRSMAEAHGIPKLGSIDDLIDFSRATRIDSIIITLPVTAEDRLLQILNRLWVLPVDIRLSAYGQKLRYRPRAYSYIGNLPCLDMFDRPLGEWGPLLKATMDKIVASLAIVILSPVLAATALAVRFDSKGPVLFKQKRFGFNNELIEIYKFRSMHVNLADRDAAKLVTKHDPRVTRVGRFIRRTSLDELPQLFNVLKGDLSLVGPRPHATKAKAADSLYEHVVDGYFARHKVKPGITGWAQINGWRGETDTAEKIERRVEHDLYYIENWSLIFDVYILARTPFALLNTDSAY